MQWNLRRQGREGREKLAGSVSQVLTWKTILLKGETIQNPTEGKLRVGGGCDSDRSSTTREPFSVCWTEHPDQSAGKDVEMLTLEG